MRVSDDLLERIRDANNIVDVVGEHVRLKKKGRNHFGLCPFHNEKSPSFSVLEEKGIFKCFGCGKGGDVFTFVMELEGLNFSEAIERLAKRANITIEEASPNESRQQSEREALYNTVREVAAFYYHALRAEVGATAAHYLNTRDITKETQKKFGIGFAPDEAGMMIDALRKKGIGDDLLERSGVIVRSARTGDWYERFRGRVIFPIFAATGRVIGFGGRILPNAPNAKDTAKYINSPDTPIYHKSQVLYGLYQSKDAIRKQDQALLVEGYLDVIALHQAGVENAVAASGTSLTSEQLNLLQRYTKNIVLLFDADQAGRNAAVRGIEIALEAGMNVNLVVLSAGDDPDSYVRTRGVDAFKQLVQQQQSFIETKAQWFDEEGAFDDPVKAAAAVRSVVESIAKIPDELKREFFIRKLAGRFRMTESMLNAELKRVVEQTRRETRAPRTTQAPMPEPPEPEPEEMYQRPVVSRDRTHQTFKFEQKLLEALLADPKGVGDMLSELEFDLSLVHDVVIRELIRHVRVKLDEGTIPEVAEVLSDFRDHELYQSTIIESTIAKDDFESLEGSASRTDEQGTVLKSAKDSAIALMVMSIDTKLNQLKSQNRTDLIDTDLLLEVQSLTQKKAQLERRDSRR